MRLRYYKFRYWLSGIIHGKCSAKTYRWLGAIGIEGFKRGLKGGRINERND